MKIGILDDRPDERATTTTIISRNLRDPKWSVVEVPLFPSPARIVEWLAHEEVNVLVADQVLSDNPQHQVVNYQGHDVVQEVRRRLPDMPVYMITAYQDNADVEANLGRMEEMVPRGKLGAQAPVLVERMKRAGETFERRYRDALSRMSELSKKKATETLTKAEADELKALQMSMSLADTSDSRRALLPQLEQQVEKLAQLRAKAAGLLKSKKAKQ